MIALGSGGAVKRAFQICVFALAISLFAGAAPRRQKLITFPADFKWGAASSAQQFEGNNNANDYHQWEVKGLIQQPAGIADDFYHRYDSDFALAQSLSHNAFRLSIEWSRIEPVQGQFSAVELEHYRKVLESARAHGLQTFVTLHHFTNPVWAANQGGWSNASMVQWFAEYVAYVVPKLGDLADYWLTINEPNVNVLTSYVAGVTPPGKQDINLAATALANFLKAHAAAYHIIHKSFPRARVGFAHHMRVFEGYAWWNPLDALLADFIDKFWNHQLLDAIKSGRIHLYIPFVISHDENWPELKDTLDFIGVNYYTRDQIQFDLNSPEKFNILVKAGAPVSDMGWEIYPHGIYLSVMTAASYGWPVIITENGLADAADKQRAKFMCDHLTELGNAMEDGADVRGYLAWALLDNWEWINGFGPRFGLVEVDYATLNRYVRPSAQVYTQIIQSGSLAACE